VERGGYRLAVGGAAGAVDLRGSGPHEA
jgi:hypothetical protein